MRFKALSVGLAAVLGIRVSHFSKIIKLAGVTAAALLLSTCGGDPPTGNGGGGGDGNGNGDGDGGGDEVVGSYEGVWLLTLAGENIEHKGAIDVQSHSEAGFTGVFTILVRDDERSGPLSGSVASDGSITASLEQGEAAFEELSDCVPAPNQLLEFTGQQTSDRVTLQLNAAVSQCDATVFTSRSILANLSDALTAVLQNPQTQLTFSGLKDPPDAQGIQPPALLSPASLEQIPQNDPSIGCPSHPNRGSGFRVFFDWSDSSPAADVIGYDLFVQHTGSPVPAIDLFVSDSEYADRACNAFVIDANRTQWFWRVRTVGANDVRSAWSPDGGFEFEPCRLAGGVPCSAPPPPAMPQDPDPSAPFPLWLHVVDPVGDHTGIVDVISMLVNFDDTTGDYEIILQADGMSPFTGNFRVNIALFNPDVGSTATFPSFFTDVLNDFSLGSAVQTQVRITGNDPALASWSVGDRVFTNSLDGTGNPDGTTLFRSSVIDQAGGFLTDEDVISFADLSQPAAVEQR